MFCPFFYLYLFPFSINLLLSEFKFHLNHPLIVTFIYGLKETKKSFMLQEIYRTNYDQLPNHFQDNNSVAVN